MRDGFGLLVIDGNTMTDGIEIIIGTSAYLTALNQTDSTEFWNKEIDGVRNADRLTETSEEAIKKRIASCYLFDSYKLSLTDEEYNAIDLLIAGIKASLSLLFVRCFYDL